MSPKQRTSAQRTALAALGAAILYGSWAAWSNHAFGFDAALRAGLLQERRPRTAIASGPRSQPLSKGAINDDK